MTNAQSLDDLRKKAHEINCSLSEENYTPREIEVIGYYLTRIASSYLSYLTHKELEKNENRGDLLTPEKTPIDYEIQ